MRPSDRSNAVSSRYPGMLPCSRYNETSGRAWRAMSTRMLMVPVTEATEDVCLSVAAVVKHIDYRGSAGLGSNRLAALPSGARTQRP